MKRCVLFALLGMVLCVAWPADAQNRAEAMQYVAWAEPVATGVIRERVVDAYLSAFESYKQSSMPDRNKREAYQRVIAGLASCGDAEALQRVLDAFEPDLKAKMVDTLIENASRDRQGRSAYVVDLAAQTGNPLRRVSRLLRFAYVSDRTPVDAASWRALELLEQAVKDTELPERSQATDPRNQRMIDYPGRDAVMAALATAYLAHGQLDKAHAGLGDVSPGTSAWYAAVARLLRACDEAGNAGLSERVLADAAKALAAAEPTERTVTYWRSFAKLQADRGDRKGAGATLKQAGEWAGKLGDPTKSAMQIRPIAGGYFEMGEDALAKSLLGVAMGRSDEVGDAKQRDHLVYALSGICVQHRRADLAAEFLAGVKDPQHALPQARNIIILRLYEQHAARARSALDDAMKLAGQEGVQSPDRAKRELEREFDFWVKKLEAGERLRAGETELETTHAVATLIEAGNIDRVDAYLDGLNLPEKDRLQRLMVVVQSKRDTPEAGPVLKLMHKHIRAASFAAPGRPAQPSTREPRWPVMRQVGSAFGGGPTIIETHPGVAPAVSIGLNAPNSRGLLEAASQVGLGKEDFLRVQWLARALFDQLHLGLVDDAVQSLRAIEDPKVAAMSGMLASAALSPADRGRQGGAFAAEVVKLVEGMDAATRLLATVGSGRPAPGNAEIDATLRLRIKSFVGRYGGHGGPRFGGFGNRGWGPDPLDAKYLELYETGMLGDKQAFIDGLKVVHAEAAALEKLPDRARALRTLGGIEAAFGETDRARATLTKASDALVQYIGWVSTQELDAAYYIDSNAREVIADLFDWRATLQIKGGEAELVKSLAKHSKQVPVELKGYAAYQYQTTLIKAMLRLGGADQAQGAFAAALAAAGTKWTDHEKLQGFLIAAWLETGTPRETLWALTAGLPEDQRVQGLLALNKLFVLSSYDKWKAGVDAMADPGRRAGQLMQAAFHLSRFPRWRELAEQ